MRTTIHLPCTAMMLGAILMMLMLMQTAHGGGPTCPAPRSSFSTSCAIETTREPNYPAPWSHYLDTAVADTMELVPPNPEELFGELFQALLDRVDGHCQFAYTELDSYSLLPERLVQSIQVTGCSSCNFPDDVRDFFAEIPDEVTFLCLNSHMKPPGATASCSDRCGDIKLSGSIESNELGVAYGINNFKMYILALQATRHTYSSEFRATLQFTRFNLDPLTGGDECGVNGDYVELFNTSSLEYTIFCEDEGLGVEINTIHTHYLTFHTDNVDGSGNGFKLEYTLKPYTTITPGFRNLEMSYYGSSVDCYDPYYDILDTYSYLENQRVQKAIGEPNELIKANYRVAIAASEKEFIFTGSTFPSKETCSTSRVGYDTVTDYVFAVFGFRARTSISRAAWQSEIDTFRDLFGLSVRADDVLVESSPWINLYNNTAGFAVLSGVSPDTASGSVWAIPETVDTLYHLNTMVPTNYDKCEDGWLYFSHQCYHLVKEKYTYEEAQHNCEALDASLLRWDHVAYENLFLHWVFSGQMDNSRFWIGARRVDGQWLYEDGTVILFPAPLFHFFDANNLEKDCITAVYEVTESNSWFNIDCDFLSPSMCVRDAGYHIGSQSYKDTYTAPSHSVYNIELPEGYIARIDFTRLDYPEQECFLAECSCDAYVEVTDESSAVPLRKLCGSSDDPPVVYSSSNHASVQHIASESAETGDMFSALISSVYSGCTAETILYTTYEGYISSPGYPRQGYSDESTCRYVIGYSYEPNTADIDSFAYGVTVLIEFEPLFDLETSNDSLTFYDGPDTSYPLLYRAVGQTLPPSIRSTASVITVVFRSDAGVNGAGFSFKYTIGCNEGRPPGLVEQFTVPGILIPRIPVTNSLPDLKCKVDLQLPKIPYVSFGARCFANADFETTCYGTNFDQSSHLPRPFIEDDGYLFNADTKLVDSFWYYSFGPTTSGVSLRNSEVPARMMTRPKGNQKPLLVLPLYNDLEDHSEYNNEMLYNTALSFDADILQNVRDPWSRRERGAVQLSDELNLRVQLPTNSPLRKMTSFTAVMWMLESSSCSDDQVLFEFRSPASDGSNAEGLLVFYDECRIIIDDGSSGVLVLDILDSDRDVDYDKYHRIAFGWNEYDKTLWTYYDHRFFSWKQQDNTGININTDFELLIIGSAAYGGSAVFGGSLVELDEIISCLQIYSEPLSMYEIENAHYRCAPDVVADVYFPFNGDLYEYNQKNRVSGEDNADTIVPVPGDGRGMKFDDTDPLIFSELAGEPLVALTIVFYINIATTAAEPLFQLQVDSTAFVSLERTADNGLVFKVFDGSSMQTRYSSGNNLLIQDLWQRIAVVFDSAVPAVELWLNGYLHAEQRDPFSYTAPSGNYDVLLDAGDADLDCFQLFYRRLYYRELVEADKVCQTEPVLDRGSDCDPGWTSIFRNTTQEYYCVKYFNSEDSSGLEELDSCNLLMYGDFETVYSSSYISDPAWFGVYVPVFEDFLEESKVDSDLEVTNVPWLWRAGYWLQYKGDDDLGDITEAEEMCELFPKGDPGIDYDGSECTKGIYNGVEPIGIPYIVRNTPVTTRNKVPQLLTQTLDPSSAAGICTRQYEPRIQMPLGVCHKFYDVDDVTGECSTGLYVPQFYTIQAVIEDGDYVTCSNRDTLTASTSFACYPEWGLDEYWFDPATAEVVHQFNPIPDSYRFPISYVRDDGDGRLFNLTMYTWFMGYGTGHPNFANSEFRLLENALSENPKQTFSRGYLQLDVGGTWRNVCDDYIRTVELACQKMTGFHCNSVTCGYIDAGVDTQAVSVEGQATTCSSATQAMWVDCHKCYAGYRVYETYSSRIISPGYTQSPRTYPRNLFREYEIKDQLNNTDYKMVIKFEDEPDIDCENGDELYSVILPYEGSPASVTWSYCEADDETDTERVRVPGDSLLIFRTTDNSTGGAGFKATTHQVCTEDSESAALTAFSDTTVTFNIPSTNVYECIRVFTVLDSALTLLVRGLYVTEDTEFTLTIGHDEVHDENILMVISPDFYERFTGYTTYWIAYSHNTVSECDEHPTPNVITSPIEIELKPVYYGTLDLTFRKCAVDYILGREEGQLSPPAFMSNESGLFNDQIAIWAIALASNRDHMIRLDFYVEDFGVPCTSGPAQSWLRIVPIENVSDPLMMNVFDDGSSLHTRDFTDVIICDDDVDSDAREIDTVHWYPDASTCEEPILVVMLIIEPDMPPIKGFTAHFSTYDITNSLDCALDTVNFVESPQFHGLVLSTSFQPREMPHYLQFSSRFRSVDDHQFRLDPLQAALCDDTIFNITSEEFSEDLCSQLSELNEDIFYPPDELETLISSTKSAPSSVLMRNDESSGRSYQLNFHLEFEGDEQGCVSSDDAGYPTTFRRTSEPGHIQKIIMSLYNFTSSSCESECCLSFSYGHGSVIGSSVEDTYCADADNITYYVMSDVFWAQIHIRHNDPSLSPIDRPIVQFCFVEVEFNENNELSGAETHEHLLEPYPESINYINVPEGYRIRIYIKTDHANQCGDDCCHKTLLGEGEPTAALNSGLAGEPSCAEEGQTIVLVSETSKLWMLTVSRPHIHTISNFIVTCTTFTGCTDLVLPLNAPRKILLDEFCEMHISTTPGSVIRVNILLDPTIIATDAEEVQGLLKVVDEGSGRIILNQLVVDNSPIAVVSDSNMVSVRFTRFGRMKRHVVSGASHVHGILLQFLAVDESNGCHTELSSFEGVLSSDRYIDSLTYLPNTLCSWTLPALNNATVRYEIEFGLLFALERSTLGYCIDYVMLVYGDGTVADGPYCGDVAPPTIFTRVNTNVTIIFFSDPSTELRGWKLDYQPVFGLASGEEGVIVSENFPSLYPPNLHVFYSISVPHGYRAVTLFLEMDVELCQPCRSCDYVAVYEGLTQEIQIGEDLCGPRPNYIPIFWSKDNQMNILFKSNEIVSGTGFRAVYEAYKDCNAVFTKRYGFFASPGYSHTGLKPGTECYYSIHVDSEHTIVLTYSAVLDNVQCAGECCSYIRIASGAYKDMSTSVGEICGSVGKQRVISTGSDLYVELSVADDGISRPDQGFEAGYFTYKSLYTEETGMITLPDKLGRYHNDLQLEWLIIVDKDYSLELEFIGEYDLQPGECLDELSVYHYEYEANEWSLIRPIDYFCTDGTLPQNVYSYNNRLKIIFKYNPWTGAAGFTARYRAIPRVFRDIDGGVVSSLPLFMPIPADVEQDYFIQLPTYYYIDLLFTRWIGINCTSAEMSIGEGGELDVYTYHHYDQYCGEVPPPVYSITNQLWIKYIQRAFNPSPDWTIASFEAVYKSELRVRTSPCTISSPGYPHNYPRHFARSWSIIAPEGFVISIAVTALDIPSPDYVLIGEGHHPLEDTLRRWNDSSSLPYSPLYVTGNEMWVWFYSHDDNQTATGFSFDFEFEQRKFNYPAAVFSSSVDASRYYVLGFDGTWMAEVRDGRQVVLNLTINLPTGLECPNANISVHGITRDLLNHCGERTEMLLTTYDNHFSIRLQTDENVAVRMDHRGFTVSYEFIPLRGDCHFEDTLCGYMNMYPIEWEVGSGMTSIPATGQIEESRFDAIPEAHIGDKYLVVRAAGHYPGEMAAIVSPVFQKGQRVISFSYLMRGPEVGTLTLSQAETTEDGQFLEEPRPLWSRTGFQSDSWLDVELFPASGNTSYYVLIIGYTLGSGDTDMNNPVVAGDVLIDDIYVDEVYYEDCARDLEPSLCFNGGYCTAVSQTYNHKGYLCICPDFYFGEFCERSETFCEPDSCSFHGSCYENPSAYNNYRCTCDEGYTGEFCEEDIDDCEMSADSVHHPCYGHGTCIDRLNGYRCQCDEDFYGDLCENQYLPCEHVQHPCGPESRAECVDLVGRDNYRCICLPPYIGKYCEAVDTSPKCRPESCNRTDTHAHCVETATAYLCECSVGYYGRYCTTKTDYCEGVTCHFGGSCVDGKASFSCQCQPGFTGMFCEREVDNCENMPCRDVGSRWCESLAGDEYHCVCREGYEGEHCESVTDYCTSSPCRVGSTCTPVLKGYECTCAPGYTGDDCETKIDYCASDPCLNEALCTSTLLTFECRCPSGYEGLRCERLIRRCTPDFCDNSGTCYDTTSGAVCKCPDDFIGRRCETRIDNCVGNMCTNGATCVDDTLGYVCLCPPDFYGRYCTEVKDPCQGNVCVHGSCDPRSSSEYSCTCDPGFTGDYCDRQIDECLSSPCHESSHCFDLINQYTCVCEAGRYGDRCEQQVDYCVNNECTEDGVCVADHLGYHCQCTEGYTGEFCESEYDECSLHPCHNGNCTDRHADYTCNCYPGFTGRQCNVKIDPCDRVVCENRGECLHTEQGYICKCPLGITGDHCEAKYDYCESLSPCHIENTLFCQDLALGYKCHCKSGWGSHDCSVNLDNCESNPCSSQGRCMDLVDGFSCSCEQGWTGRTCASPINSCLSTPCHNGGTCNNLLYDEYVCTCPLGTRGDRCQDNIDNCQAVLCRNGGVCRDLINDFICDCPLIRYAGRFCELDLLNLPGSNSFPAVSVVDNDVAEAAALSGNEELIDLSSEERGPCDFGTSSKSITFIVANIVALVLLAIICIIVSQYCISKEKRYREKREKRLARRHHHHQQHQHRY